MSYCYILPTPAMVEDTMHDMALTPYKQSKSAFNFEAWQEVPLDGLPQFLPFSLPQANAAPSTDSTPEAVIHSVPLQFQPQRHKGKASVRSWCPTTSNAEFQGL